MPKQKQVDTLISDLDLAILNRRLQSGDAVWRYFCSTSTQFIKEN